jgi:hypothetical protein
MPQLLIYLVNASFYFFINLGIEIRTGIFWTDTVTFMIENSLQN